MTHRTSNSSTGIIFLYPCPAYGGTASVFARCLGGSGHVRVRLAGFGSVPSGVKVSICSVARIPARASHYMNEISG
jgi:hypothetical protein